MRSIRVLDAAVTVIAAAASVTFPVLVALPLSWAAIRMISDRLLFAWPAGPRVKAIGLGLCSVLAGFGPLVGSGATIAFAHGQAASAGEFVLPVETRWGPAVLPAGAYTYRLDSAALPAIIEVRGEGKHVLIMVTGGISLRRVSDQSTLTLYRNGQHAAVRSLQIGHLGRVFYYHLPKGPELKEARVEHITVTAGTK